MKKEQINIGLFGGTFNPIQLAHLIILERFIEELNLKKCIIIPNNVSPFKSDEIQVDAKHRIKMLKLAIGNDKRFKIDNFEIKRGGISHTIDTILYLKTKYPYENLFFLIGSDHAKLFDKWHKWKDILENIQLVIALRPKTLNEQEIKLINEKLTVKNKPPIWIDAPQIEISASEIRKRASLGKSIKYLVPRKVEKYIHKHKLYCNYQ